LLDLIERPGLKQEPAGAVPAPQYRARESEAAARRKPWPQQDSVASAS